MTDPALVAMARQYAAKYALDPFIVCALCQQESAWNPWAVRMEPGFYLRYTKPLNLSETEEYTRAISWGLMQVMGQTAREHGFKGRYLSELCNPAVGLDVGCRVFASYLMGKGGDVRAALLRWNGGGRPAYADEVLARVDLLRSEAQTGDIT